MAVQTLIQVRRGTTSQWNSVDPTLHSGEWGYDTDLKRYKIGDGSTSWQSLPWAALRPDSDHVVGTNGIGVTFAATTGVPATISVTGITASQVTDFNSAVDARVTAGSVSPEEILDIAGTGLVGGSGVAIDYQDASNLINVVVTGIDVGQINSLTSTVSELNILDGVTSTATELNILDGVTASTSELNTLDGVTSSTSELNILDGVTASTAEINVLDGSTEGTVTASNAVVADSNKDITGFRDVTVDRNIVVGGNLSVNGTTTTVNSTTVDIGDNIIRVNTSGLTEGGLEVQDGTTGNYKKFVWDNGDSRFEADGSIEADGFIGPLTGNATTVTNGVYTTDTGSVTSTMILNDTIVNADINSSADIAVAKLAAGTTGQVLQTNGSGAVVFGSLDGGSP